MEQNMKKILAGLALASVFAGMAFAQTQATSQNAVGFVSIGMTNNNMYALSVPFVDMNGTNNTYKFVNLALAQDAANGSTVYFWDSASQKWITVNKTRNKFNTDKELAEGEFFFFKPSEDMTGVLAGEVPSSSNLTVTVLCSNALSAIAYPFPTPLAFTNSTLASEAPNGSTVYFWDETNQQWVTVNKTRNKFNTDKSLEIGRGAFFKLNSTNDVEWSEDKLYTYP